MLLKNRILELVDAGYKQTQLAKAAGKTRAAVTHWLNGETVEIKADSAAGLQALTGYNSVWISTGKGPKKLKQNATPCSAISTTARPGKNQGKTMANDRAKIESTDEAWELGQLGASEAHARPAAKDLEAAIDESLGLQSISIHLPKQLIDAYKLIAAHHGVGYQPLMRDILQRFAPEGLKDVLQHHEAKAGEVDHQIEKWKKAD